MTELSIKVTFLSVSPSPPCEKPKDYVIQQCSAFPGRFISKLGTTFNDFDWPEGQELQDVLGRGGAAACKTLDDTPAGVP